MDSSPFKTMSACSSRQVSVEPKRKAPVTPLANMAAMFQTNGGLDSTRSREVTPRADFTPRALFATNGQSNDYKLETAKYLHDGLPTIIQEGKPSTTRNVIKNNQTLSVMSENKRRDVISVGRVLRNNFQTVSGQQSVMVQDYDATPIDVGAREG